MNNIYKITRTGIGFRERVTIKSFKTSDAMHKFLNTDGNALFWNEAISQYKTLKAGTYAFAGGVWHNVKTLDSSVLAHI